MPPKIQKVCRVPAVLICPLEIKKIHPILSKYHKFSIEFIAKLQWLFISKLLPKS